MGGIVIYGSRYGSAKRYAEELAQRTGFELKPYSSIGEVGGYDAIAYVGSVYAGNVLGMKQTLAKLDDCANKSIAIVTVGLTDPADSTVVSRLEDGMRAQLPEAVGMSASMFHLRGAIDYARLGLPHRAMMWLLRRSAKKMPEDELSAEMRVILETYGKRVSFMDMSGLDQVEQALKDA